MKVLNDAPRGVKWSKTPFTMPTTTRKSKYNFSLLEEKQVGVVSLKDYTPSKHKTKDRKKFLHSLYYSSRSFAKRHDRKFVFAQGASEDQVYVMRVK